MGAVVGAVVARDGDDTTPTVVVKTFLTSFSIITHALYTPLLTIILYLSLLFSVSIHLSLHLYNHDHSLNHFQCSTPRLWRTHIINTELLTPRPTSTSHTHHNLPVGVTYATNHTPTPHTYIPLLHHRTLPQHSPSHHVSHYTIYPARAVPLYTSCALHARYVFQEHSLVIIIILFQPG